MRVSHLSTAVTTGNKFSFTNDGLEFLEDIGGFTGFQFLDDKVILFLKVVMFGTPITAEVFRTDGKTFTVKAVNARVIGKQKDVVLELPN